MQKQTLKLVSFGISCLMSFSLFSCSTGTSTSGTQTPAGISPSGGTVTPTTKSKGIIKGILSAEGFNVKGLKILANPLPGASVFLEKTNLRTITNDKGEFTLTDVPAGKHNLIGEKGGGNGEKVSVRSEVNVKEAETVDLQSLLLKKTATLVGTVKLKDKDNHSGINVYIAGSQFAALTDENGDYTLINVPEGTYDISSSKSGYKTTTVSNIKASSGEYPLVQEMALEAEPQDVIGTDKLVTADGTGIITGVITDGAKGVAGAIVSLQGGTTSNPTTMTDKDGKYLLGNIPPGDYSIQVYRTGFDMSVMENITIEAEKSITQDIKLNSNVVTLGQITGTVVDITGKPVRIAAVYTTPNTTQTITDNDGKFTLTQIYPGDYLLIAAKGSLGLTRLPVSIDRNNPNIEVNVTFGQDVISKSKK